MQKLVKFHKRSFHIFFGEKKKNEAEGKGGKLLI